MRRLATRERSPVFDQRDQNALLEELAGYAAAYLPEWRELWPANWRQNTTLEDPGLVLCKVFARLTGILIERVNAAPEKHRRAFYDFLGVAELAALPARVPLCFDAVSGLSEPAFLPRRTEVTGGRASQAFGPVVFETEENLRVVPGTIDAALMVDGASDSYIDLSAAVRGEAGPFYFQDTGSVSHALPHTLMIGLANLVNTAQTTSLQKLSVAGLAHWKADWQRQRQIGRLELWLRGDWLRAEDFHEWFVLDPKAQPQPLKAAPGIEYIDGGLRILFENFQLPTPVEWNHTRDLWLGVNAPPPGPGRIAPEIRSLELAFAREQNFPDAVFQGRRLLAEKEGFLPFGKKPTTGEYFYIGAADAFAWQGGSARFEVQTAAPVPLSGMQLRWEYWDGADWALLGCSAGDGRDFSENREHGFYDGTAAFTHSGTVSFRIPEMESLKLHHKTARWLRVTLAEGEYHRQGELSEMAMARRVFSFVPPAVLGTMQKKNILEAVRRRPGASLKIRPVYFAPRIKRLRIVYSSQGQRLTPASLACWNNFKIQMLYARSTELALPSAFPPFAPFVPFDESGNARERSDLYLGISGTKRMAGAPLAIFLSFNDLRPGRRPRAESFAPQWSYYSGGRWKDLQIPEPPAATYLQGGIVRCVLPPDAEQIALHTAPAGGAKSPPVATTTGSAKPLSEPRYWLRLSAPSDQWHALPISQGIYLNAVMAVHSSEYTNRLLGAGNHRPGQTQRLPHTPVLGVPVIQVRESLPPDEAEQERIREALLRQHRIPPPVLEPGENREVWVTWTELPGFALANAVTRGYVLDRETGEIQFGDGHRGMAPGHGRNNIRASYTSGGGRQGNVTAGHLNSMRKYVRGVQSVRNPVAAVGGTDVESAGQTVKRGAAALATRDRAVTVSDFEQIAGAYSQLVDRVHCHMQADGQIIIAVLPRHVPAPTSQTRAGPAEHPDQPHPGLLAEVEAYVKERAFFPLRDHIRVIAPKYVRVGVRLHAVIHPDLNPSAAISIIKDRLRKFLDPFEGDASGDGWNFGEDVNTDRVAACLRHIEAIQSVRELVVFAADGPPTHSVRERLIRSPLEIVAPGPIEVRL